MLNLLVNLWWKCLILQMTFLIVFIHGFCYRAVCINGILCLAEDLRYYIDIEARIEAEKRHIWFFLRNFLTSKLIIEHNFRQCYGP